MKQRALVVYELLSSRGVWFESSTDYYVGRDHIGFLGELSEVFSSYNGNCRIKSITFYKSYE